MFSSMRHSLAVVSLALFAPLAAAQQSARTQLDQFVSQVTSLTGRFEQRVYDAAGRETERSMGTLALSKPRQFRWDYVDPYEQKIVADGTHVWVYDVDLEQASVRPQSFDESNSPIAVLLDLTQLDIEFKVVENGEMDGMRWLRLLPKSKNADFKTADFGFDGAGLQRLVMSDNFKQRTELRFSSWVRNPKLPADHFTLKLPANVDVIGDLKDDAQITPIQD